MKQVIIIRGPAGIGKTTISKELSNELNGDYLSIDKVLEKNKLDNVIGDGIPEENFIKVNEIILKSIIPSFNKKYLIIDGNFYRLNQLNDLVEKLNPIVIYLVGDLNTCMTRNKLRSVSMTSIAIKEVFELVSKVDIGKKINTQDKTINEVVKEIFRLF